MGEEDRRAWSRMEIDSVFHAAMQRYEQKLDALIESCRDGNQAALLTASLLVGNESVGLQGFIPETRAHFVELDKNWATSFGTTAEMKVAVDEIRVRQGKIEAGQHRIRKALRELYDSATRGSDGKLDYTKIMALLGAGGGGYALAHPHLTAWGNALKRMFGW